MHAMMRCSNNAHQNEANLGESCIFNLYFPDFSQVGTVVALLKPSM